MATYARRREVLLPMYAAMAAHFGPSNWWPGNSPFEIALGAILTQNTAWRNVEKALEHLRTATKLVPSAIAALPDATLCEAVRPAGFFTQKSATIRRLLSLMASYGGLEGDDEADARLACFEGVTDDTLREALLCLRGIGPETADCILLYGMNRPVFVVDAYTRRIFHRHGLVSDAIAYGELQEFFMEALPSDVALYNEYHALIVRTGKEWCGKTKPKCGGCPLQPFLEHDPV